MFDVKIQHQHRTIGSILAEVKGGLWKDQALSLRLMKDRFHTNNKTAVVHVCAGKTLKTNK